MIFPNRTSHAPSPTAEASPAPCREDSRSLHSSHCKMTRPFRRVLRVPLPLRAALQVLLIFSCTIPHASSFSEPAPRPAGMLKGKDSTATSTALFQFGGGGMMKQSGGTPSFGQKSTGFSGGAGAFGQKSSGSAFGGGGTSFGANKGSTGFGGFGSASKGSAGFGGFGGASKGVGLGGGGSSFGGGAFGQQSSGSAFGSSPGSLGGGNSFGANKSSSGFNGFGSASKGASNTNGSSGGGLFDGLMSNLGLGGSKGTNNSSFGSGSTSFGSGGMMKGSSGNSGFGSGTSSFGKSSSSFGTNNKSSGGFSLGGMLKGSSGNSGFGSSPSSSQSFGGSGGGMMKNNAGSSGFGSNNSGGFASSSNTNNGGFNSNSGGAFGSSQPGFAGSGMNANQQSSGNPVTSFLDNLFGSKPKDSYGNAGGFGQQSGMQQGGRGGFNQQGGPRQGSGADFISGLKRGLGLDAQPGLSPLDQQMRQNGGGFGQQTNFNGGGFDQQRGRNGGGFGQQSSFDQNGGGFRQQDMRDSFDSSQPGFGQSSMNGFSQQQSMGQNGGGFSGQQSYGSNGGGFDQQGMRQNNGFSGPGNPQSGFDDQRMGSDRMLPGDSSPQFGRGNDRMGGYSSDRMPSPQQTMAPSPLPTSVMMGRRQGDAPPPMVRMDTMDTMQELPGRSVLSELLPNRNANPQLGSRVGLGSDASLYSSSNRVPNRAVAVSQQQYGQYDQYGNPQSILSELLPDNQRPGSQSFENSLQPSILSGYLPATNRPFADAAKYSEPPTVGSDAALASLAPMRVYGDRDMETLGPKTSPMLDWMSVGTSNPPQESFQDDMYSSQNSLSWLVNSQGIPTSRSNYGADFATGGRLGGAGGSAVEWEADDWANSGGGYNDYNANGGYNQYDDTYY